MALREEISSKEELRLDREKRYGMGLIDASKDKPPKYRKDPYYMAGYNFEPPLTDSSQRNTKTIE